MCAHIHTIISGSAVCLSAEWVSDGFRRITFAHIKLEIERGRTLESSYTCLVCVFILTLYV
jgi:hypothetical protein